MRLFYCSSSHPEVEDLGRLVLCVSHPPEKKDVLVRLAVALGNDNNGHDKSEDQLSSHLFGLEVD